jgi:hypothetical protein
MDKNNSNNNCHHNDDDDAIVYKYTSGIPTLRSSSHRVRNSDQKLTKSERKPKHSVTSKTTRATRTTRTTTHAGTSTNTNTKKNDDNEEKVRTGTMLPASIQKVEQIPFDMKQYNFQKAIIEFLHKLDSKIVGEFKIGTATDEDTDVTTISATTSSNSTSGADTTGANASTDNDETKYNNSKSDIIDANQQQPLLENFQVPTEALRKKSKRGILLAQDYLSQAMHDSFFGTSLDQTHIGQQQQQGQSSSNTATDATASSSSSDIVEIFDSFVTQVIVPHLKNRMIQEEIITSTACINFYYQRPPTLRIQPGPSRAKVNAHKDKDYGHQEGELNFWIPLTDRIQTGVDLHAESKEDKGDYQPLETNVGYASSFFGTGFSHYVNSNSSKVTRVSLDFRVGIEPFYDPNWVQIGTRDDHFRRHVQM